METTDNHTPTPEELALCIEESAVRAADACEQSPAVLRVDSSVIETLGNFSTSIGKAKSKKTFNVAALTAAALTNGTVLHYRASFPEEKRGILYIDTEQGRPHCQQVLRRILRLAGLPEERDPDNLVMLTLRKFPPDMRLAIVGHAIGTIPHLGLVIIDGIRDLLYDINSPKEATDIISRFMQWTDDRQIHIHTILHQNKNDENARGHIGTELNNKAETVMQIEVARRSGRSAWWRQSISATASSNPSPSASTARRCPSWWNPTSRGSGARGVRPRDRSTRHATFPRMYTAQRWMPFLRRAASAATARIRNG